SYPKRILLDRYRRLGFTFSAEEVFTSREVMLTAMRTRAPRRLGLMLPDKYGSEEMEHLDAVFLADDPAVYDDIEEFLLIGSGEWTERRQSMLEESLRRKPRPVLVGNPDIVAPRETGLSREPGYYAHRLADVIGLAPEFYGKPFANIFEYVLTRLPGPIKRGRIVMVGDTLQTDILGGRAAGLKTAMITNFGSLAALDAATAAKRSGIVPDFVLPEP
ncbi:MAG: HAD-IIA family hydrolase, partial [Boseongicola sp.]